ncbi:MAG: methyltransferase domain-containing protein [Acaryochloridaceae cyanobacterium SU_2_1]|nr:methyltransferase domain-containing protein [Acaryochloridaceae cyanobacterium SU_2_1]
MRSHFHFSETVQSLLSCPICKASLELKEQELYCLSPGCANHFPIINQVPILLNEAESLFSIAEFTDTGNSITNKQDNPLKKTLSTLLPSIDVNQRAEENYKQLAQLFVAQADQPKVLVIGCGNLGQGIEEIFAYPEIELIESDIYMSQRTMLVCDAHDLPFMSESFDGVIIQAVLEHVVDPHRCVAEIHRVLKPGGIVYAETPFMQQVHMGRHDFTRFTHLGHRRLFRNFDEVESGAVGGPGMALAWSYQYFLLSFTQSYLLRKIIKIFTRLTSFYLQYFDKYLINKPGVFDAASGYFFIGRKGTSTLSDKELIRLYKGSVKS